MAKKKAELIESEIIEEVIEEVSVDEVAEEVIEEVVEEPVQATSESKDNSQFIFTQLKMINKLNNPARARRLAERVLRNKK